MKISIITAVLNAAKTIDNCMRSIANQTYNDIEHIVVDGGSTDGTLEVLEKYKNRIAKMVSETDEGIYDALNKGIKIATGLVIGILNSDDFYAHERVIEKVADIFTKEKVDSCYGDLQYVGRRNHGRVIRHWKSSAYRSGNFRRGWMLPHPTFFVRKEVYKRYGYFNTDFKIASDYELMLRFLEKYKISTYYIPDVLVKMRIGGTSNRNLKNILIKSLEDYRAWKVNNLNGGFCPILLKNLSKIPQFFIRH